MTILTPNISAQDVGFSCVLDGRVWRWKTRADLTGSTPSFQILDIITPFGVLRDSIPLPGPVVQAMAESIDSLQTNFKPTILVGPPTTISIYVDEGRGYSVPVTANVTNSGVFGSLLSVDLSTSAPYLITDTSVVGHLAFNQSGSFEVSVDSTDLLASSSPYAGTITLQDPTATNNPQTLPVAIVVRPKAVISLSPTTLIFTVSRPLTGPFPVIATQQFTVQNSGPSGSVLDYQVMSLTGLSANWLGSFDPVSGTLAASQVANITVGVDPVEGLLPGTYEETLRVSGYSYNDYADIIVRLVVT